MYKSTSSVIGGIMAALARYRRSFNSGKMEVLAVVFKICQQWYNGIVSSGIKHW